MRKANSRREIVSRSSAQPLSVALTAQQRQALAREGERRGMALSTTVRTLALERLREVATEDDLQRARRWQSERSSTSCRPAQWARPHRETLTRCSPISTSRPRSGRRADARGCVAAFATRPHSWTRSWPRTSG